MKYSILSLFFSMLLCTASTQNWWKSGMSGEGDVITREIDVPGFEGVSLGFSGDIYLTQGSPQKVVVKAQENIIDNIRTAVKHGVWRVNFDRPVRKSKPVKVYITMPTLKEAGVSGSGSLESTTTFRNLNDVQVYVSGSGDVKLMLEGDDVESTISGSGEIYLDGRAHSLEISISGSGDVEADDLRVNVCEVAISGSGDATVHALEELHVRVSGSGDVKYKGEPAKVRSSVSGSGDVEPMYR